jgi:signal transduction histidine kinase
LLERDVRHARLWIEDDGCGFAPGGGGPAEGGFGLKNIAERARILEGRLMIDSTPGGGTRLELILNLPNGT